MSKSEQYMQRCLDLAIQGANSVSPNPMVGAVIVYQDRIIGEGFTSPYGGPHAEVNAINAVLSHYGQEVAIMLLSESSIYVSLEPCAHFGKTPPCADMLVKYQFKRVIVGCLDPFAKVNGLGIEKLRDAGIEVEVGVLEKECQFMNRRFFTRISKHRPYVILKWAQTENGFIAPKDTTQQWISNNASKQLVHKWRSEEDAILIGVRTALVDNPSLNTRLWEGKSPKRVLIDRDLTLPKDHPLYHNIETDLIIFNAHKTDWQGNIKFIELENFDLYLPQNILYQLYLMDVQSIIIDGGAKTLNHFIEAGLWDEARVFVGDTKWLDGVEAPTLSVEPLDIKKVSTDSLFYYYNY
ncbi:bifunctional diaminohydroxyphosphoribosylaminopyrimidine deaminase/5-amino-6-(5-phosphoribosylamino)uracil reductase RibD [Sphingobacterium rhinopitheci]|uniref:bifunctional diaminohydroxyphosphoribosylaminopyrimidine deaminase/5-amino-6-(5-phosphoribosylamino)uracil reductase RibD n=1 Tax=Sphingobacterium rhinopitheci TaxID=2781960 RepID=UPI001F51A8B3|nr:bifunctional diaminohydroxyphosphoribosylaminopyrimidine deaminase/5-amino-6-(5-phosphoribosylamino)uracil reductase RibD [Sphingobacterium rhinopitheci]MCI0919777.1 bifunctional diaminohydroxyphosphoribosylaminopyrimidine deaminase/5-amino-6-(5-phosphoribosylamino)uracil reductase RibD [Sphingobacterium rhinopitheci]